MLKKSVIYFALVITSLFFSHFVHAVPTAKGIYINQGTLENLSRLNYLIKESKAVGINTFIVDLEKVTPNYRKNIQLIKDNGIHYIARIVIFPDGAKGASQLKSAEHHDKRLKLLETAIDMGAEEIQLDYIRYSSKQPASPQNAYDVKEVIKKFKTAAAARHIPLQVDIFGEVSFKESSHIGQNIQVFADTIDAACPMVYPSHYHPYQKHSKQPYQTVYNSLEAMKKQFNNNKLPFRLTPYIEASNYHYKMSPQQKSVYVLSQIRAVEDANADGWFIWSPKNHYDHVFSALKNRNTLAEKSEKSEKAALNADKGSDKTNTSANNNNNTPNNNPTAPVNANNSNNNPTAPVNANNSNNNPTAPVNANNNSNNNPTAAANSPINPTVNANAANPAANAINAAEKVVEKMVEQVTDNNPSAKAPKGDVKAVP